MKIFIQITLILFLIYGCSNNDKMKKQDSNYELADRELSDHKEKIALLSSIKNVPYDTLYLIIKEYYAMTSDYDSKNVTIATVSNKAIDTISKTFHLSKSKVASCIFSFKYEMQTRQDIMDQLEQEAQDLRDQEDYDPR